MDTNELDKLGPVFTSELLAEIKVVVTSVIVDGHDGDGHNGEFGRKILRFRAQLYRRIDEICADIKNMDNIQKVIKSNDKKFLIFEFVIDRMMKERDALEDALEEVRKINDGAYINIRNHANIRLAHFHDSDFDSDDINEDGAEVDWDDDVWDGDVFD